MSSIECAYCGLPVPGTSSSAQRESSQPLYCCYGCHFAAKVMQGEGESTPTLTRTRTLLGVAIFLSMNVMVVNWMLYGQEVYNPEGTTTAVSAVTVSLFRYLSMLFSAPVLAILGWPILQSGFRNLRAWRVTTDLLISLGAAAAFIFSYISVMRESGNTYFDTVCMILVLVTLGKYLEATAKIKTTSALRELESLLPDEATVVRDGEHNDVPIHSINVEDVIHVKPGCRMPVDGTIVENQSHIDEQIITGESEPVLKGCGDKVYAGTLNNEGAILVRVEAIGEGTVLHDVVDLLVAARRSKGRYERLADRLAAVFVPVVLVLSLVAAGIAFRSGGFDDAVMRGLAVLLISCPCALGLATPMAVWVALGQAARKGVLFRNVVAIERLARIKTVCFDKTGTLTTGKAEVTSFDTISGEEVGPDEVLAIAGALAQSTTHHLSTAIMRYVNDRSVRPLAVSNVQTVVGRGVTGIRADTGREVSLGNPAFMRERRLECNESMAHTVERLRGDGKSLACIGWDGAVRGLFAFAEQNRPEAKRTLETLRHNGLSLRVLTGDHEERARRLGEQLGIEVEAELLPADKIARIRALSSPRLPVAMVGDGINDAPALAAADVGIAMGCGADVTRESADVTLAGNDLSALVWSIHLSARTVRVIRQNLFWAFAYNTAGIALAMTGKLSPIFAALAMVLSSLLVVTNSLRLNRRE